MQYDLVGYAHVNVDGVHEFYGSVRGSYRDFNPGDPFAESEGSGWRGELDRAYYRFDLQRYYAAYKGETINYNVTFEGGRQLITFGGGGAYLFATHELPPTYLRYVERKIREAFELGPTPIKLRVRRRNG